MRNGRAMTEDAVISVVSAATRIACKQMTLQHLDALHASLEQASGLPTRPDWGRKATAHAELFNVLAALTGDRDLALQVSSAAGPTLRTRSCSCPAAELISNARSKSPVKPASTLNSSA